MKSSLQDLHKRGMTSDEDVKRLSSLSIEELFEKLTTSTIAAERSAATIILREKCSVDDEAYILTLLNVLTEEKALYTRIEICKSLAVGNESAARLMCNYLGKIGNNQHLAVPDKVSSKKKNYPLPRDIIARYIGRMDKKIINVLFNQLQSNDVLKTSEILDCIGYLVYNHPELATDANLEHIERTCKRLSNDLITWRVAVCCSVFPTARSISLLNEIRNTTVHPVIKEDAERSLKLIGKH